MYNDIKKNKIKTSFVFSGFLVMIFLIVYALYYTFNFSLIFVILAMIVAIISMFVSYYNCDKIILATVKARPATGEEDKQLTNILEALMLATGLPSKPRLYVVDSDQLNAFATGRNPEHSIICVTRGLLEKLDYYELEAVVAHELSHVKNYDILLASIISVMVGFVVILSDIFMRSFLFSRGGKSSSNNDNNSGDIIKVILIVLGLVLLVLSPIISNLIQLAVSRKREYLADATAVGFTRNPQGLISALHKLDDDTAKMETASKSNDHMYIVSPFKDKKKKSSSIFSTHPSIEDRVKAIAELQ